MIYLVSLLESILVCNETNYHMTCTNCFLIGNIVTQLPNYPFQSTTHFITEHMIPRIKSGRYKFFVQHKDMLRFGVGPIAVNGKTPPTTSELALQDGDVTSIQDLLKYLICDGKENYIVHLVLAREDKTVAGSYEVSSPSRLIKKQDKAKDEASIKKESKGPVLKKVKQEPRIKVSL